MWARGRQACAEYNRAVSVLRWITTALFIASIPVFLVLTNVRIAATDLHVYSYSFSHYDVPAVTGVVLAGLAAATLILVRTPLAFALGATAVAALGVATVPALYLFVRSFFGWRPALLAAAFLTVSYWHIHYSRTAFTLIAAPLAECVALYLLAIGVRTGRGWAFAASGLVAGIGVYTYRGYLFFALLLALVWVFWIEPRGRTSVSEAS